MIPGSANPLLLASAAGAAGYVVERSIRLNSAESAYLSRTPASAGNRKTWTWAGWVKRSALGSLQFLFTGTLSGSGGNSSIAFTSSDTIYFRYLDAAASFTTTAVFRDPSAWYHIVAVADTDNATANDRLAVYVNGVRQLGTISAPTLGQSDGYINFNNVHFLGTQSTTYSDLYLADIHFIDGQALDPTSFGEFDTNGVWQPKAYTGTYPGNSFHLPFSDNSTAAALGTDTSGNGNDWTVNNISGFSTTGNYAAYVYASNATYNPSATGTSYYTGAGSQFNGFDGNTNTYVGGENVAASWVYFRPTPSLSSVSQLRVFAQSVEQIYVNGSLASVTPSLPNATSQWYTIVSPPSTVTEIAVQGQVSTSATARFSAIEVNGVVLIDNKFAAGNDSLVDTPTSYGTDTGAGGEVRGNYATLNPLDGSPTGLSNGNLDAASANAYPTIIPGSGQWYYEVNGTSYQWDGTRANWTPRAGSHNFGQRAWSSSAPNGYKALCTTNLSNTTITTSGTYTGNGVADGPFVYLNGVPTAMTVNGNAVTFGTEADKLSNGFKVRTTSTTYNQNAATYSYSITSTGDPFKVARAQSNP